MFWKESQHPLALSERQVHLAYLLSTMNLGRLSGQSAQPGISVKTLGVQEVVLPSKFVQEKVAGFLESIDQKIDANEKINNNLAA